MTSARIHNLSDLDILLKGLLDFQVDVTDHIEGHSSYLWATQHILDELEMETYYPVYNIILPKE